MDIDEEIVKRRFLDNLKKFHKSIYQIYRIKIKDGFQPKTILRHSNTFGSGRYPMRIRYPRFNKVAGESIFYGREIIIMLLKS